MKIIFIYNAGSGKINTLLDIGHKVLSPNTYSCNLCSLTHGLLSERDEWRKYRVESKHDLEFLHKDEFENKYNIRNYSYPIVLKSNEGAGFEVLISTEEIDKMNNVDELIKILPK